jgi:hypothetical protein
LSEERDLDGFAVLDLLTLLDEDLAGELAAVLSIERRHTISLGVIAFLKGLKSRHEVMSSSNTMSNNSLCDTSSNSTLDNGSHGIHGPDNLGLELGRDMELDLLEKVFGGTETTDNQDVLESAVLGLDGNDLVSHELQDTVDNGLETLKDLLVGEGHVTLLNTSLRELSLDTNIDSPLLTVVSEISLDSVLEVHDTLGVDSASGLGAIGKLHLSNLGAENVAEITVQGC